MRRNCNLELQLFPVAYSSGHRPIMEEEASESPQQQQNKLTIFYEGKMCVCDVTELKARSILMAANKEMEERVRTPNGSEPSSPIQPQMYSPSTGLSMKRSLQRFLQTRRNRNQEACPYHH